jgi:hypothetical protein
MMKGTHLMLTVEEAVAIEERVKAKLAAAILAEREACAQFVADGANGAAGRDTCCQIAEEIRKRQP